MAFEFFSLKGISRMALQDLLGCLGMWSQWF